VKGEPKTYWILIMCQALLLIDDFMLPHFISCSLQFFKGVLFFPPILQRKELRARPLSNLLSSNSSLSLLFICIPPHPRPLFGKHYLLWVLEFYANNVDRVGLQCTSETKWNLSVFKQGYQIRYLWNEFCTVLGNIDL